MGYNLVLYANAAICGLKAKRPGGALERDQFVQDKFVLLLQLIHMTDNALKDTVPGGQRVQLLYQVSLRGSKPLYL